MKIVVLSDGEPFQLEFIRQLNSHHSLTWLRFTYEKSKKTKSQLSFIERKWAVIRTKVHRLVQKGYLGFPAKPSVDVETVDFSEINKPAGVRKLRSLRPDILFACGAPILKGEVLKVAPLGCYNIHFGISPDFRGNETIFWTYYSGLYDLVGGTFHEIDTGIDTGKILGKVYPALTRFDGVATAEIKIARLMAGLVSEFLWKLEKDSKASFGVEQKDAGKLFLSRHRTIWKDLMAILRWLNRVVYFNWKRREAEKYF